MGTGRHFRNEFFKHVGPSTIRLTSLLLLLLIPYGRRYLKNENVLSMKCANSKDVKETRSRFQKNKFFILSITAFVLLFVQFLQCDHGYKLE